MADEPFVDTHIHFFDKAHEGLQWAWLEPGFSFRKWSYDEAIDSPRYCPPEFRAEAAGTGLAGAVHVHCADPLPNPADETAWIDSLAVATGWPQAQVGRCDLDAPDAAATIAAESVSPLFRGIRDPYSAKRLDAVVAAPAMDALAEVGASLEVRRHHNDFAVVDELELVEAHGGAAEHGRPLGRRQFGHRLAVQVDQLRVRHVRTIDREVRREHAAFGTERLDAGEHPRTHEIDIRLGLRSADHRRDLARNVRSPRQRSHRRAPRRVVIGRAFERQATVAQQDRHRRPTRGELVDHGEVVVVATNLEGGPELGKRIHRRRRDVGVESLGGVRIADASEQR